MIRTDILIRDSIGLERDLCGDCSGSGEGMTDGSRCSRCRGVGEVLVETHDIYACDRCGDPCDGSLEGTEAFAHICASCGDVLDEAAECRGEAA